MDDFSIFDAPEEEAGDSACMASMVGTSETPILFPLIASFVAQHATRLLSELQDAAALSLAQHLEGAACKQAGYDLQQAAALADGCWSVLRRTAALPPCIKEAYVLSQLLLATAASTTAALQHLDRAYLLGGPRPLLHDCVSLLEPLGVSPAQSPPQSVSTAPLPNGGREELPPSVAHALADAGHTLRAEREVPRLATAEEEPFRAYYSRNRPVVVEGLMADWEAPRRWSDLSWLSASFGDRIVPVEVGTLAIGADGATESAATSDSTATDVEWHECMMPLRDFISTYLLQSAPGDAATDGVEGSVQAEGGTGLHAKRQRTPRAEEEKTLENATDSSRGNGATAATTTATATATAATASATAAATVAPTCVSNAGAFATATGAPVADERGRNVGAQRGGGTSACARERVRGVAYVAQHSLFEQLPALRRDFSVPSLCQLGRPEHISAWFGTANTVTPLHFDSEDNLFAQVVGYKYIRLYARDQSDYLYPGTKSTSQRYAQGNFSSVDVEKPNFDKFPRFKHAKYSEVVLRPGDMLFIPARCWHFVRSMSTSFSISFWF